MCVYEYSVMYITIYVYIYRSYENPHWGEAIRLRVSELWKGVCG